MWLCSCSQALMMYLLGSGDRPPQASPLISAPKLAVDDILVSAHLMTGAKSETRLCFFLLCGVLKSEEISTVNEASAGLPQHRALHLVVGFANVLQCANMFVL